MNLTTLILVLIAGISNAMMDTLKNQWPVSRWSGLPFTHWWFRWSGPSSWHNKWKNGIRSEGPRFFLSSTALVFLTDGWHFFQFLWGTCFVLAIVFYEPIGILIHWLPSWLPIWVTDFIILKSVYLILFNLFYEKIFR